jgi:hypothetical protein
MRLLPDVNVWIALSVPNHSNHSAAIRWFNGLTDDDLLYFCRVTQQGYLRLATTKAALGPETVSNTEAWQGYLKLRADSRLGWLDEPQGLEEVWVRYSQSRQSSPKKWTDAYLAALCQLHGATFVSFDKGFGNFDQLSWIELSPAK